MAELIGMVDSACDGIVLSPIVGNVNCATDPDATRGFFSVSSEFYLQLRRCHAWRIDQWFEVNHPSKETAETPDR